MAGEFSTQPGWQNRCDLKKCDLVGEKNRSRDVIDGGEKLASTSFRTENHQVTWGTWENKGPPYHVMLSFCCFCTLGFFERRVDGVGRGGGQTALTRF